MDDQLITSEAPTSLCPYHTRTQLAHVAVATYSQPHPTSPSHAAPLIDLWYNVLGIHQLACLRGAAKGSGNPSSSVFQNAECRTPAITPAVCVAHAQPV
jgi:hypothetical protein